MAVVQEKLQKIVIKIGIAKQNGDSVQILPLLYEGYVKDDQTMVNLNLLKFRPVEGTIRRVYSMIKSMNRMIRLVNNRRNAHIYTGDQHDQYSIFNQFTS